MRALYHFDLARVFAKLPSTTDMNDLASYSPQRFIPRIISGPGNLTADIRPDIEDIETALPLLSKDKQTGHINYWGALAIRARAYLYLEKNKEALADCKEIIASSPYKLYTRMNI